MSWIVQSLLSNKNVIKEAGDINSDEYNDLLRIEMALNSLQSKGVISPEDLDIIAQMTGDSPGLNGVPKHAREAVYKKFDTICERIGFYLGGYFTDEGYLWYMRRKYNLSDEQVEVMRQYMGSVYKRKIMRKGSLTGYKK